MDSKVPLMLLCFLQILGASCKIIVTKAEDFKPRINPRKTNVFCKNNFLDSSGSVLRKARGHIAKAVNIVSREVKDYPISCSLVGLSLSLSAGIWVGWFNQIHSMPKDPIVIDFLKSLVAALTIPQLNGVSLLNLASLYHTLKELERSDTAPNVSKVIGCNAVILYLMKLLSGETASFNTFSRSLVVTNSLKNPEELVSLYGVVTVKNKYLPVYLILGDYLMTLRIESGIEGCYATAAGSISYALYKLFNKLQN